MCAYAIYILRNRYYHICYDPEHDAEDIVSDVFWKIFSNIHMIDQDRSEREIKAYLYTILNHQIYDHYKGQEPIVPLEDHTWRFEAEEEDVFERIAVSEENEIVKRAINRLSEPYRSTLNLYYIEELNPKQIANTFDVPVSTIYSRLSNGKQKLLVYLKEEGVRVDEYFQCKE